MKTGLILEGGAMRGLFTCGVTDVFLEYGITFDGMAGISAGATFGCNYKSKQNGRAFRYNVSYNQDPRYGHLRSLWKTGNLYDVDFCYHEIPDRLDPFDGKTFAENPMEFYVGATNVETGKCVFHKCTDGGERDVLWMQASASLPLVSKPVSIDGYVLLDGGISDPVPYRFMESKGYDRNVIILTQPSGYRKPKSRVLPLLEITEREHPKIIEAMRRRHRVYNRQMEEIREREVDGRSLVIRPPEALGIGRTEHNPEELIRVYQIGRAEGIRRLSEVQEFLGRKG